MPFVFRALLTPKAYFTTRSLFRDVTTVACALFSLGFLTPSLFHRSSTPSLFRDVTAVACPLFSVGLLTPSLFHHPTAGPPCFLPSVVDHGVQVMGQEKKTLSGFSSKATLSNAGLLYHCDVVQLAPPYLRPKALKITAYKVLVALDRPALYIAA